LAYVASGGHQQQNASVDAAPRMPTLTAGVAKSKAKRVEVTEKIIFGLIVVKLERTSAR
jgi:hypothetical protein